MGRLHVICTIWYKRLTIISDTIFGSVKQNIAKSKKVLIIKIIILVIVFFIVVFVLPRIRRSSVQRWVILDEFVRLQLWLIRFEAQDSIEGLIVCSDHIDKLGIHVMYLLNIVRIH